MVLLIRVRSMSTCVLVDALADVDTVKMQKSKIVNNLYKIYSPLKNESSFVEFILDSILGLGIT